jgi:class 3 adenylate cyclase/tetratricopeptide (TPR) repeat protein
MAANVESWLESLGLCEYADVFAENDIDVDILPYLTEEHLEKLGISMGNRLRILKAIGILAPCTLEAPMMAPADQPSAKVDLAEAISVEAPISEPTLPTDAERRPLTVMFCDLADSTALSTQLDPEDLQDVIRAYQKTCTEIIREFEGFIARYSGDGILVYFGYPKSLERNAERAVRTAQSIVDSMEGLSHRMRQDHGVEIAVRIGISTGMVMVGELIGEGMAQERTVVGEAPNIAARLQGLAARNGIVIGSLTRDLSGDAFTYEDLGKKELKGIPGLVQTWAVVNLRDESVEEDSLEQDQNQRTLNELVGRHEETGLLRRAWQSVKDEGRGQVVYIAGESGLGKSSLIDGLRTEVRIEGLSQGVIRCSPYHTNSAFYPLIEHTKRLAFWQTEDSVDERLSKLKVLLNNYEQPLDESLPLLATVMSLPLSEDNYPVPALPSKQLKQMTQDVFIAMILESAEHQSLLLLWEDMQWADPSTLELVGLLIDQTPTASLLMMMTSRPEFIPPWQARSHITPITLNRLEGQHAMALIARVADNKPLPKDVIEHIVSKADGVPLYVEELTKTILSADILRDAGDRFELTGPLSSLSIPDTLQESLMARLDRLPQVRALAQLGSVLGREFAYEMISGLSTQDDGGLQAGLEQLVDAELLYQRGRPPRARYIFKHALIQDVAYESLLRRDRQQHHLQVAQLLESDFSDVVESNPELVAHHYSEANQPGLAVDYYQIACEQSLASSANLEAVAHLSRCLELIESLPQGANRDQRELNLLMKISPALIAIKGYAAVEVEASFLKALALCQKTGDEDRKLSILQGLALIYIVNADLDKTQDISEQLVVLAKDPENPGSALAANQLLGYALSMKGDMKAALSCFDCAISGYDFTLQTIYSNRMGTDFAVGSYGFKGFCLFALGYPEQAFDAVDKALSVSLTLNHPLSEAFARIAKAIMYIFRCEPPIALEHAEAGAALASEKDLVQFICWGKISLHSLLLQLEKADAEDAIISMQTTIDDYRSIGAHLLEPFWLVLLAQAYSQNDQTKQAVITIDEAFKVMIKTGEKFWHAELHRIKGKILLESSGDNHVEAESNFHKAIEISRTQNARGWELRATTNLARLWLDQNKAVEARQLLAPIYNWFTEGFETTDLREAKTLLDELSSSASYKMPRTNF